MKNKNGTLNLPVAILSVFGFLVLLFGSSFVYFSLNGKDYSLIYSERIESGEIKNPLKEFNLISEGDVNLLIDQNLNLTDLEEEMLGYALVKLEVYNLHNIPFTSQTPKIEVEIDENVYSVEVSDGDIQISRDEVSKEDITIKTTQEEIIKMMGDESYVQESFSSGNSNVELDANKFILFSKGYSNLYNGLKE